MFRHNSYAAQTAPYPFGSGGKAAEAWCWPLASIQYLVRKRDALAPLNLRLHFLFKYGDTPYMRGASFNSLRSEKQPDQFQIICHMYFAHKMEFQN